MTETPLAESQLTRRFRFSQKTIVRTFAILAVTVLTVACALCLPLGMFSGMVYSLMGTDAAPILLIVIGTFAFVLLGVMFIPLLINAMNIIALFKSYLDVNPEGVTYQYWGQFTIKARWQDVDRIGPYGPFKQIVMHLRDAEIDEPIIYQWRRSFFRNPYPIQLSSFEGWPDGELAETIRQYAPHLMEEYPHGPDYPRQTG